tara:strand:+ start:456 stop:1160 length:705 start_codon:yes stop_codon:yes gene_type:complete
MVFGGTIVLKIMTKQRILVCPICGETQNETSECRVCSNSLDVDGLLFAEGGIGPWWVRDEEHPFQPGMTYDLISEMAKNGKIELHTIIRGPTTRQLWKVARRVPGISHLLGRCYSCGEHVEPKDRRCVTCETAFLSYRDRNNLGVDIARPSEGKVDGMSSFLSDTSILDTHSTPLSLPKVSESSNNSKDDSVGSPQFHSLQRRIQQSARTIRILSVFLTLSIIALIITIVKLFN